MTTIQGLADQAGMIINKDWFSDFEILEIYQQINRESCQQDPNTVIETINIEKKRTPNRNKTQ